MSDDLEQFAGAKIVNDPVNRQLVMAILPYLLDFAAQQDIDHVILAETVIQPCHRRQDLFCDNRSVKILAFIP